MRNAGPYARLKFAMDYWCALWFWPIDKADMLPSRSEFLNDLNLILVGTISTGKGQAKIGYDQLSLFDEENEELQLIHKINQIQGDDKSEVDLDSLCMLFSRFELVRTIANQNKFMHWELEFADLFAERGGFDLVIGNPPWVKASWNEVDILAEFLPYIEVKGLSANDIGKIRSDILDTVFKTKSYISEYVFASGQQCFLGSSCYYPELGKMSINLYKNFIPIGWSIAHRNGMTAFVHPDSVYDDPKGTVLREAIYKRLVHHFHFRNENKIFPIHNTRSFSVNIYKNGKVGIGFDSISNLFSVGTVDACYENEKYSEDIGIKDAFGNWNTFGNNDRILKITIDELKLFAGLFDGNDKYKSARLPVLQCKALLSVLKKMNSIKVSVKDIPGEIVSSEMWNERGAQGDGTIEKRTCFPNKIDDLILSGSHIGLANAFAKTPRRVCTSNKAFDEINTFIKKENYLPRTNYIISCDKQEYVERMVKNSKGIRHDAFYRLATRKMVDPLTERTLIAAIIPPYVGHINGLISTSFSKEEDLVNVASLFVSLPYDFFNQSNWQNKFIF